MSYVLLLLTCFPSYRQSRQPSFNYSLKPNDTRLPSSTSPLSLVGAPPFPKPHDPQSVQCSTPSLRQTLSSSWPSSMGHTPLSHETSEPGSVPRNTTASNLYLLQPLNVLRSSSLYWMTLKNHPISFLGVYRGRKEFSRSCLLHRPWNHESRPKLSWLYRWSRICER